MQAFEYEGQKNVLPKLMVVYILMFNMNLGTNSNNGTQNRSNF